MWSSRRRRCLQIFSEAVLTDRLVDRPSSHLINTAWHLLSEIFKAPHRTAASVARAVAFRETKMHFPTIPWPTALSGVEVAFVSRHADSQSRNLTFPGMFNCRTRRTSPPVVRWSLSSGPVWPLLALEGNWRIVVWRRGKESLGDCWQKLATCRKQKLALETQCI